MDEIQFNTYYFIFNRTIRNRTESLLSVRQLKVSRKLITTFCFVNPGSCYLFDFDFKKDGQSQKSFKLIMENL